MRTAIDPNPLMILPFGTLLACIALMPLACRHFWEAHYRKIVLTLGAISVFYYAVSLGAAARMLHAAGDYASFIVLIGSLFIVSGGIHIHVTGSAKPAVNCFFLLTGALLANLVGTTGASMLLIRPWIKMNRFRFTGHHTAFFIFLVSNVGGCLTPMGPPLYLGYLKGVPFWWVASRGWPGWVVGVACLVAVFYAVDRRNFLRAPEEIRERQTIRETWRVEGLLSLPLLIAIPLAVFIKNPPGLREAVMIVAAVLSYGLTTRTIHAANHFTFEPIREVAWLFAGIFATMVPALDYLALHAGLLGIRDPAAFYWVGGALSSVLDNAPTYLAFLIAGFGLKHLDINSAHDLVQFLALHGRYIMAVSLGSVFFGAITYIGNGPNLMVKSIADHAKVHTPHFLEFTFRYALPIMIPILVLVSLLYFSRWSMF